MGCNAMVVMRTVNGLLCADGARLLLAVVLLAGTLALLLTSREVPNALWGMDGAAVGFYFGGLAQISRQTP